MKLREHRLLQHPPDVTIGPDIHRPEDHSRTRTRGYPHTGHRRLAHEAPPDHRGPAASFGLERGADSVHQGGESGRGLRDRQTEVHLVAVEQGRRGRVGRVAVQGLQADASDKEGTDRGTGSRGSTLARLNRRGEDHLTYLGVCVSARHDDGAGELGVCFDQYGHHALERAAEAATPGFGDGGRALDCVGGGVEQVRVADGVAGEYERALGAGVERHGRGWLWGEVGDGRPDVIYICGVGTIEWWCGTGVYCGLRWVGH